jgi:hypothetical protein
MEALYTEAIGADDHGMCCGGYEQPGAQNLLTELRRVGRGSTLAARSRRVMTRKCHGLR